LWLLLPIECIKEVSEREQVDERTAAWKLSDMLKKFKTLSGIEKAIQQATQQLAMLNMVNDQQKRAINTLVHLQQIGMTEDEIGELVKLVGRRNGTGVGLGQGNGNGNRDKL
jgi:DNA-binding SARP family transcriptional activator